MGDRVKGTEGFGIIRAFGAVALLVALYGVSLSAAALIDRPLEPGAKRLEWFAPAATAVEQPPALPKEAAPGRSFWTPTGPTGSATPSPATESTSSAGSFWGANVPRPAISGSKLAGELARTPGRM